MRGKSATAGAPGAVGARKWAMNQPTCPGATYAVVCTAASVPSVSASDACAPATPRYHPTEPVFRSATTHSTGAFGAAVGYDACVSNAARYALSGGSPKWAGHKFG